MKAKTDLFSSIIMAVVGVLIAFLVTNLFIGPVEDFSYKKVNSNVNADLIEPDPEIFNYKALNPTVEVYVGDCTEYDRYGECVEVVNDTEEIIVEEIEPETENQSSSKKQPEKENAGQENR